MAEHDTIKTVKSQQGLLDKIQNFFLGGFATKEDLREHGLPVEDFLPGMQACGTLLIKTKTVGVYGK